MSSFIAPKKKLKKQESSINDSKDTFILIPDINIVNLDKEYIMKDITENATKKLVTKNTISSSIENKKTKLTFLDNPSESSIEFKIPDAEQVDIKALSKKQIKSVPVSKQLDTRIKFGSKISEDDQIKSIDKENDKKQIDLKFVTKLSTLGISNEQKIVNFETIIKHEPINVKMFCSATKKNLAPSSGMCCWWCRHSISSNLFPIGLPIKYKKEKDPENKDSEMCIFETEGYFCSFNCVLSYNNEMCINNIRYRETGSLIYILYKKIFGEFPVNMSIKPSPNWKLLKAYGGSLTINEFRNSFQVIDDLAINYIKSKQINIVQNNVAYIEEISNQKTNQNVY